MRQKYVIQRTRVRRVERQEENVGVGQTRGGSDLPASTARRLVRQRGGEPSLTVADRAPLAARVADDLVFTDAAHGEVTRLRMREVEAADARRGKHRRGLGQRNPGLACLEQIEQLELLAVVRTRGVAEAGADAAVLLVQDVFGR